MQTLAKALQAFMRPIGPFPFRRACQASPSPLAGHPMMADYTETCLCGEDTDMAGMLIEHDPFHWVHTMTIAQALDQIRIEEGLQRHAALFGP